MGAEMFKRQKSGAVLCRSCGKLVGVNDEKCLNCGHANPALWGFAPALRRLGQDLGFVPIVIGGCAALYAATLLVDLGGIRTTGLFSFLSPSMRALFMFGASGAVPVFGYDRWWTVLSAAWLHGGLLHIIFNMMWIRQLAPATAELYGPGRMMIIYTVAAISGFGLSTLAGAFLGSVPFSFLQGARFTIGASAAPLRLAGSPGTVRQAHRQQLHSRPGIRERRGPVHLWSGDAGRRQLCPLGRVCRRLFDSASAGSAAPRTSPRSDRRGGLHRAFSRVHSGVPVSRI